MLGTMSSFVGGIADVEWRSQQKEILEVASQIISDSNELQLYINAVSALCLEPLERQELLLEIFSHIFFLGFVELLIP